MLWGWLEQCWCSRTAYEPKPLTDRTRCCKDPVQTIMSQWVLFPALKPELSSTLSSNDTWAGIRTVTRATSQYCDKVWQGTHFWMQQLFIHKCSICSGCYLSLSFSLDAAFFDTVICSSLGRRGAREGPKKTIKSSEITAACHPNQQVWPESAKKGWKRERKVCTSTAHSPSNMQLNALHVRTSPPSILAESPGSFDGICKGTCYRLHVPSTRTIKLV